MSEDKPLDVVDVGELFVLVEKFRGYYRSYRIIAIDDRGVHVTYDEVIHLSKLLNLPIVQSEFYHDEKDVTYTEDSINYDGVKFHSQRERKGK